MDNLCTHTVGHLATGRHINVNELEASCSRRRLGHIKASGAVLGVFGPLGHERHRLGQDDVDNAHRRRGRQRHSEELLQPLHDRAEKDGPGHDDFSWSSPLAQHDAPLPVSDATAVPQHDLPHAPAHEPSHTHDGS